MVIVLCVIFFKALRHTTSFYHTASQCSYMVLIVLYNLIYDLKIVEKHSTPVQEGVSGVTFSITINELFQSY